MWFNTLGGPLPIKPREACSGRAGGPDASLEETSAGSRLHPHRRHAGDHRALHSPPATRRLRRFRLLAPSRRGSGFGHRSDIRKFALAHGTVRQRKIHDAGRHADAFDRGFLVADSHLQAGVSRRLPVAHCARRFSDRRRHSGRRRDARAKHPQFDPVGTWSRRQP